MKRLLIASLVVSFLGGQAFAANSTVNSLPAASALDGTELLYGVQSSADKKVTGAQIKAYANGSAVRATTTTSEALANSDQNKLVTFSNGSAVAATIAQAGSGGNFAAGWVVSLKNLGAGTVTLTPATSTVDGAATVTLTTGQGLDLYSDGTNYFTQAGKGSSSTGANPSATGSDVAVNGSASTFMRSDGAPAIQKGTNAQFGLAEGDGASIDLTAGVVSRRALTGDVTASAGSGVTTLAAGSASNLNSGNLNILRTASGVTHPGYKSSVWYLPSGPFVAPAASGGPTAATAYCSPGQIGGNSAVTITALGIRITTLGSSNIQLAIYNDNASSPHRPGTLIDSTPNIVDTSAAPVSGSLNATHQINPGWYWFCIQTNDATVRYLAHSNSQDTLMPVFIGSSTLGNVVAAGVSNTTGGVSTTTGVTGFGTWPDFTAATFTEVGNIGPSIAFQFSSVP